MLAVICPQCSKVLMCSLCSIVLEGVQGGGRPTRPTKPAVGHRPGCFGTSQRTRASISATHVQDLPAPDRCSMLPSTPAAGPPDPSSRRRPPPCASAASASSRSSPSPHQSRKLERKSCGTASMSRPRRSFESVLSLICRPVADGNTGTWRARCTSMCSPRTQAEQNHADTKAED